MPRKNLFQRRYPCKRESQFCAKVSKFKEQTVEELTAQRKRKQFGVNVYSPVLANIGKCKRPPSVTGKRQTNLSYAIRGNSRAKPPSELSNPFVVTMTWERQRQTKGLRGRSIHPSYIYKFSSEHAKFCAKLRARVRWFTTVTTCNTIIAEAIFSRENLLVSSAVFSSFKSTGWKRVRESKVSLSLSLFRVDRK